MKQLFSSLIILIFGISQINAQISLHGTVSVQNSKTKTGETEYVPNAQIECDNGQLAKAQPKTSDSEGKFILEVYGKEHTQIAILVTPKGKYQDYMVVNHWEVENITLGRTTPIEVYICKKGELEKGIAAMVGINLPKQIEPYEKKEKEWQKKLKDLEDDNDHLKSEITELQDSIKSIKMYKSKVVEVITDVANSFVTSNLDDKDDNYIKAYNFFAKGELDSVKYYLKEEKLNEKYKELQRLKEKFEKEKKLGKIPTESIKLKEERYETSINNLIQEWLLLARVTMLESISDDDLPYCFRGTIGRIKNFIENRNNKVMEYYEKAINADTLNLNNIFEYANYSYERGYFSKSEAYYLRWLNFYEKLEKKYADYNKAKILNNLGWIYYSKKDYEKSEEYYYGSLNLYEQLNKENPKIYLPDLTNTFTNLAITLENIANNYYNQNDYDEAEKYFLRCLEIREDLSKEESDNFPYYVYKTLLNLRKTCNQQKNYPKSIHYLNTINDLLLKYREKINYKPYLAQNYGNLSWYYLFTKEYVKSEESARKALELDNTKTWIKTNLAHTLLFQNHFSKAEKIYKELSQTIYKDGKTYTQTLLDDFEELEKARAIPEERKADIEKIRKMLKE